MHLFGGGKERKTVWGGKERERERERFLGGGIVISVTYIMLILFLLYTQNSVFAYRYICTCAYRCVYMCAQVYA